MKLPPYFIVTTLLFVVWVLVDPLLTSPSMSSKVDEKYDERSVGVFILSIVTGIKVGPTCLRHPNFRGLIFMFFRSSFLPNMV